jgi:integrase
MGTVYQRGEIWWIRYSKNGRNYWESSRSKKKQPAIDLLKLREGELVKGEAPGITYEKVKFEDLMEDIIRDYTHNNRNVERLQDSLKHLKKHFGGFRVPQITTSSFKQYIQNRMKPTCLECGERLEHGAEACPKCGENRIKPGAANGTINRERAALRRMLNLGYQDNKVGRVPYLPKLEEANPREGFFEHQDYLELLKALPSELRPVVMFAYKTGWRKEEILGLTWDRVDLKERLVFLSPEETKNKSARSLYLSDELLDLLKKQNLRRGKSCSFVFHRNGKRILDFRGAWQKACEAAGIPGKLFHDFRRTAVRNLTRSGTQEAIAMKITGHKTRSVFDRYNITSQEDIKAAMQRQEKYLQNGSVTIS